MRLNVGFLLNQGVGFSRNFDFDLSAVKVDGEVEVAALSGVLRFTRTAQGLYGQGLLEAQIPLECVRCLKANDHTLKIQLSDLFVYPSPRAEDPLLAIPESGMLDLNPLLREYLLLDIPMRPLCSQHCRGLCPVCGKDLEDSDCDHPEAAVEPRMAALKTLLPDST